MIRMRQGLLRSISRALKVNVVVLSIDVGFLVVLWLLGTMNVLAPVRNDFFPLLLLLEAGVVFLIGGAIALSGSIFPSKIREHVLRSDEKWSKEKLEKGEAKANLYILTGIFLFLESVILALLL